MTPEEWSRLKSLFVEALELSPEARSAFVRESCADAPRMREELEGLLAHHERTDGFLDSPVRDLGVALSVSSLEPEARTVGHYRLIEEIGRGGMGTVYLAERADEQFQKRVAIKVIKRGMDSEEVLRRFLAERQILARLEHPNIARLLDGGITEDGRPFYVMEYVEGIPIHEYCRERDLGLTARLELFRDVCAAVHYAHQSLVIHRDLKPSNILVTADGAVKLLDFGIARVLTTDEDDDDVTRIGHHRLTLAYASPEQVRRHALTTASDVYSLGMLLYELLVGTRPYETGGKSPAEVERIVCEERPVRPSVALGRRTEAGEGPSDPRAARRLRGDLDTIVLTALNKEPERRYDSAKRLADDLTLYLRGRPVTARPDRWTYRVGKFVSRHRWGTVAASVVAAVLVAGGVALAAQSVRVARERDRATEVSRLLIDIFQSSDPRITGADTVTARQLLDRGVSRVRSMTGQADVKASLLDVIGLAYHSLGLYEEARPLMDEALRLKQDAFGPDDPETATSLNNLGNLLQVQGRIDEAEPLLREALRIREEHLPDPSPELAQSLNNLSQLLLARRDFEAGEPLLLRAVAMQRALDDRPHADLAQGLNNLGLLYHLQGRYDEAVPFYRESLAMQREVLGSPHPDVAQTTNNLGLVLQSLGRYDEAEPLYLESLEMRRSMLGPSHPRVGVGLNNVGLLLFEKGEYARADSTYREALDLSTRALGRQHPQTAIVLNNLADVRREQGALAEAEALYDESYAVRLEALGAEHPHVAYSLNGYARLRQRQGRLAEADSLDAAAVSLRRRTLGEGHPDLAVSLYGWGTVLEALGRPEDAEARYRQALDIRSAALPEGHPLVAESLLGLGRLLAATGRAPEAEPMLVEAVEIRSRAFGDAHWRTAQARDALARCRSALADGGT